MIDQVDSSGAGQKIVIYGKSGIGKSTLASLADNAVFLDIDGGCSNLVHPQTGEPVRHVGGIETFQDLRDVLRQPGLFNTGDTVVLDTITRCQTMAEQHVLENVPKDGKKMRSIKQYGWGDGDNHVLDQFRLLFSDFDALIAQGVNVILLAQLDQIVVSNSAGTDYLEDGPKLLHRRNCSIRTELVEWADQVLRIGYLDLAVAKETTDSKSGKVIGEDVTRAVFAGGAQHFIAKSRPVNGNPVPPVVYFRAPNENGVWTYVFGQEPYYTEETQ